MAVSQSPGSHISVVTPVYGCADCLQLLYNRLIKSLTMITDDFDIIMVNDASPDGAWECIQELSNQDSRVRGINFSRNFGQHHAITAGLDYAEGDWVVVMDCDLQDQPEEIQKMYAKAQEGYEIVFGIRQNRQDSFLKVLGSNAFALVLSYFIGQKVDNSVCNFTVISRKVVKEVRKLREQNRAYSLMINWFGFSTARVNVAHSNRAVGKTSYSFRKLIHLAFDVIVSHSNKPLRLSVAFGFLMAFASLVYGTFLVGRYFIMGVSVEGWTSVMVSIYLLGGLTFANLGILGIYFGKTFNEGKKRPLYTIESSINIPVEDSDK